MRTSFSLVIVLSLLTTMCVVATPVAALPSLTVTHAVSCLAGNARVDTNIVNDATAGRYRLEFQGLSPRETTVGAFDWARMPVTGRRNGNYQVIVKKDGVVVSDSVITTTCNDETPTLTGPELTIQNACRGGLGYVLAQFVNASPDPKSWVLIFDDVPNRSTSAAPWGSAARAITGRSDGSYTLAIRVAGEIVTEVPVVVDCQPDDDARVPVSQRTISAAGIEMIKAFEGSSNMPYTDPAGACEIGIGFLLSLAPCEFAQEAIDGLEEAFGPLPLNEFVIDALFEGDIERHVEFFERDLGLLADGITQHEYDALASLAFNAGPGVLERGNSPLLRGEIEVGPTLWSAQALTAEWEHGCPDGVAINDDLTGLCDRRAAESNLFLTGEYPSDPNIAQRAIAWIDRQIGS